MLTKFTKVCSYTTEILAIIQSSGHSPADFYAAGKAPLSASTPAPTPKATPTQTPTSTPAPTPTPTQATTPTTPVVAPVQAVSPPKAVQEHVDQASDPHSMTAATIAKLDAAKQATEEKAQTNADNWKHYLVYGFLILGLTLSIGFLAVIYFREWRERRRK